MSITDVGGRNTQPQPAPAEGSLETELQDVAAAVAAILAHARAIDPVRDEFGHARSGYYSDAVTLLKVSAKLGHSIAALRGSKFEHNINVRREGASPLRRGRAQSSKAPPPPAGEGDRRRRWRGRCTTEIAFAGLTHYIFPP